MWAVFSGCGVPGRPLYGSWNEATWLILCQEHASFCNIEIRNLEDKSGAALTVVFNNVAFEELLLFEQSYGGVSLANWMLVENWSRELDRDMRFKVQEGWSSGVPSVNAVL
jgi:hypothetical protein